MANPFSFEEASQPVDQTEQAKDQPVGFSFEEAMQPPQQAGGFSFEQAFAPVGAEPEEPFVEKTRNPFMGMVGRVAGLAGSGIEAVAEVGERAGDWLETNLPISGLSKEEVAQQKQLQPLFNWAKSLKDYERSVGYAPSTKLKELGENPLNTVPFIAERVITSAPDMAAAVLNLPAYVGARTKEILDERVKNDNKTLDDATVGDVTSAAAAAVIEGTLERFATKRLGLGEAPAGTSKAGRITREGGVQAGTEAVEETAAYAGEALGTEKGFDTMEALERAAEGAIVGGGLGATAQGVKEALPKRETEEDKLITELRGLESEPTTEEDMGEDVTPGAIDERAEPRVRQPEPRVDAGAVEPSVSVPIGGDETAAGVTQPVAERVVDDSGVPAGVTERAGEVDTALETPVQEGFTFEEASTPGVTPEVTPEVTTPVAPTAFNFDTLIPQDDPKSVEKFAEIKAGKKKAYAQYSPLVTELESTANQLAGFIQEQGFDPNNLAELRSAPAQVQDAIKLLNALGTDARNMGQAVRNQERQYASAKTEDARTAAKEKGVTANARLTDSVKETLTTAQSFLANPTAGTGDIVFSDTRQAAPGGRGSDFRLVRQLASRVMSEWDNAPRTKVVQSITELPDYMQEQIKRDNVNPQGAYDPRSNQVFLISDNLNSADDVFMTVAHEALGHFGLRSILGDAYTRVMNEIYNGHKDVKAKADAKLKANPKMTREIAVEEVLAEMAEASPKPTPALRRLFDAIRRFARRIGLKITNVTDGELQQLVANASRYVRKNQLKYDPFTKGVVQPGGPSAVKGLESVYSQGFKSEAGPARVNPSKNPNTEAMSQGRPKWEDVKGKFNINALINIAPGGRQLLYKTMTLRMLKDIAGKRLPQLGRAIDVTEKMVSMRTSIMRDGADVLDKVQALGKTKRGRDQIRLMGEIQVQATMLEIDPDPQSKFYKPNATLEKAWKALDPEAQAIYREMRGFYETQIDGMVNDMMARVDRNLADDPQAAAQLKKKIIEEFGPAKRKGPYFPLRRFGNYWFQVGKGDSKEFYMFESASDRDYWMAERVKELQAAGQQDLVDEMSSGDQLRGDNSLSAATATLPVMKRIEEMVDASALQLQDPAKSAKAVEELKDSMKQLQYLLLPGTNIRKMFIHRKGIQGASTDAVRAFSTSVVNLAYQRARTKYAEQFYQNVDNGFAMLQTEPNTKERRVLNDMMIELDSRTDHILGMEPTTGAEKLSNAATQFSFLYLLTAPASALVNVFGMTAVGIPYVGAAYGYPQAAAKSLDYMRKYIATAPKFRDGNTAFPTLDKATNLTDVQRRAYDRFLHDNAIDVSLTQDIMGLSQAPFEKYSFAQNKIVRGISALFHHSERMNREVLNMTAFDLAYDKKTKAGMDPEQAFEESVQEAKDLSMMSLGDFTRASKPPVLAGPVARVVFQFKQYSLLMTYNMLRNTVVGFNPFAKNITPEQKAAAKEARRRMYGVMGMTALYAGLKGMPIFTATSMIAEALNSVFGDDEDDWDFEYWLQGYLQDTVGGKAAASIMRGVIAQGTNTALSERMSLDLVDLWFRDSGFQRSAEDTAKEFALANLGPTFSIFLNFAKAKDLHDNYNGERALETMLPTIMRNLVTVQRYAREGEAQTTKGITIDDDISYSDLFVKALGFTPEDIMQKQKANIARKGAENKINLRRERLLAGMYMALHFDDGDMNEAVLEKIMDFNEKYPEVAITSDTIQQSMGRKLKDKAKQEALGGVEAKLSERLGERYRSLSE